MEADMAADVDRIDVSTARAHAVQGTALLVCGYEDDAKCRKSRLEGSMPLAEFASRADTLPKDKEVIFYCA
jgi:rhodanese-related sulfurtransferase